MRHKVIQRFMIDGLTMEAAEAACVGLRPEAANAGFPLSELPLTAPNALKAL
jgi:hypothetical protein